MHFDLLKDDWTSPYNSLFLKSRSTSSSRVSPVSSGSAKPPGQKGLFVECPVIFSSSNGSGALSQDMEFFAVNSWPLMGTSQNSISSPVMGFRLAWRKKVVELKRVETVIIEIRYKVGILGDFLKTLLQFMTNHSFFPLTSSTFFPWIKLGLVVGKYLVR
jgi:hypothetical protein